MKAVIMYKDQMTGESGEIIEYRDERGNILQYEDVLAMLNDPYNDTLVANRCPDVIFFLGNKTGGNVYLCTNHFPSKLEAYEIGAAGSASVGFIRYTINFGPTSADWTMFQKTIS